MMAFKKSIFVATLAAFLLTTGCGNNTADNTSGAAEVNNSQEQQQVGQQQGQGQGRSPMMNADLMGKIKSINGQTITVYKSSFVPDARGGAGQQPPGGGDQAGADGQQPPGGGDQAGADGQQPPQGNGQNRPNMANMFSDETVDIQVTDSTKIIKTTFENQERKETVLTIADLKADDIVSVDLADDTQNAVTITLSEGGSFGGMGGGMGGGRQGKGQGVAPAAPSSDSAK
ncbi:hypothetical protein [Cohnella sp. WQ 127256]|uniref:hypothetical protein n=1 Tax=Cohnella sp. WQ 127256 TaxID=2938790 RepID=UPI002118AC1A|nr:hypothetical protein [Cohnella sp. WQ 127256]